MVRMIRHVSEMLHASEWNSVASTVGMWVVVVDVLILLSGATCVPAAEQENIGENVELVRFEESDGEWVWDV